VCLLAVSQQRLRFPLCQAASNPACQVEVHITMQTQSCGISASGVLQFWVSRNSGKRFCGGGHNRPVSEAVTASTRPPSPCPRYCGDVMPCNQPSHQLGGGGGGGRCATAFTIVHRTKTLFARSPGCKTGLHVLRKVVGKEHAHSGLNRRGTPTWQAVRGSPIKQEVRLVWEGQASRGLIEWSTWSAYLRILRPLRDRKGRKP